MRVIAGSARGMRLLAPAGRDSRPTSDRVREALFSSLGPLLPHGRVLDLFAGSGALAIEALSRGVEAAVLVERDPRSLAAINANLERTGLAARATVVGQTVQGFCRAPVGGPFDVVLCDPPYAEPLPAVVSLVEQLAEVGAVTTAATVVVERSRRDPALAAQRWGRLAQTKRRSYGDTVLLYLGLTAEG